MRVALDTNRYVDLCKGGAETVALLEEAEAILLPFVVVGELRAGFAHGRRQAENERILRRFLLKDGVRVLCRRPDHSPLRRRVPPARKPARDSDEALAGLLVHSTIWRCMPGDKR